MTEHHILTEENMHELEKKINRFLGGAFLHSHDWILYPDDEDREKKEFKQLRFERRYPIHHFKDAVWKKNKRRNTLMLQQKEYLGSIFEIESGAEIRFEDKCIYVVDTKESSRYYQTQIQVAKYFK